MIRIGQGPKELGFAEALWKREVGTAGGYRQAEALRKREIRAAGSNGFAEALWER
jgi:hypothetical protein